MRPLPLGHKVKSRVHHAPMKKGESGTVNSVHNGVFYGVGTVGGGVAYMPAFHCDPSGIPDADDVPGANAPDNDADDSAPPPS